MQSQSQSQSQRECDSCRSAPAAVYCRADAAALCAACDADIHDANPISRRHHRVPVPVPVPVHCNYDVRNDTEYVDEPDGEHSNNNNNYYYYNYEALFGEEEVVVDYLQDLVEFNSCTDRQKQIYDGRERVKSEAFSACVVPVQSLLQPKKNDDYHEMEYEVSNAGFGYSAPVVSQCVSLSSMDAGHIVPNNTDNPNSYAQPPKGTMELFSSPLLHIPGQLSPMDREARVLRYREKKKNRKFEKTIRYASRKTYAEARPRIKGRFAKRTDVELEVDRMFSTYALPEDGYDGIVPSF